MAVTFKLAILGSTLSGPSQGRSAPIPLHILNQTVAHINESPDTEQWGDSSYTCDLKTYVEWAYLSSENKGLLPDVDLSSRRIGPVLLRTMDDIITAIVLLATASSILVGDFTKFRTIIALTGDIRDNVKPYKEGQFSTFSRMYTDQLDKYIRQRDVLRLSQALDSGFFSRCSMMTGSAIKGFSEASCRNAETSHMVHKLKELTKEMKDWVIDENSVAVQCRLYVWSVVALAMLFARVGLAIGFSVGQRIKGVDPSNSSTCL
jgi:hypothetical protein